MSDWRSDPGWRLVEADPAVYTRENAPPKPTAAAELAPEKIWASEYRDHRIVATWFREIPIEDRVRDELVRRAARRLGLDAPARRARR